MIRLALQCIVIREEATYRVDLVVPARPEVGAPGNNAWPGVELLLHRHSLSQSLAAGVGGSVIRIQRIFGLTDLKADWHGLIHAGGRNKRVEDKIVGGRMRLW